LEQGRKAGAAAARKIKDVEDGKLRQEGAAAGEKAGAETGAKAGAEEGEKVGATEAERIGGDEGEKIGREIAGDEGAALGRELGAKAAKVAGAKVGLRVGRMAGGKAGQAAGKKAAIEAANKACFVIGRERVAALVAKFTEIAKGAAQEAAIIAARAEAMKAVKEVATRAARKAARDALMAMVAKSKLAVVKTWKPSALIAVINARSDLTDMEKVKLAAKAKLEGNLTDLLPQAAGSERRESIQPGEIKVTLRQQEVENFEVGAEGKWKTVVFSEEQEERREKDIGSDNVTSLKKRFETRNMKDNEAYVIM